MAPKIARDPVLKKKWERVFFTFFDLNKSKSIDYGDFDVLFEKIKSIRGEDSNEYKIAMDSRDAIWRNLVAECHGCNMFDDFSNDEVEISLEEWDAMWARFNPRQTPIWLWEYIKFMFNLLDTSGDKYIDEKEYADVMKIYGVSEKDAHQCFADFAKDSKGKKVAKVDYGFFSKLFNQYFTSTDDKCPANHLFGP